MHTHKIPEFINIALRHALAGRKGPVFLEIPIDVLLGGAEESEVEFREHSRSDARILPDGRSLDRACELLARAERPAIMAGSAVWWDGAWEPLGALAQKLDAPVYLNSMGRGALPRGHPHLFNHSRRTALANADTVLVVGAPLDFRLGYGQSFSPEASVIQIDIDARELGRNRDVAAGLVGNADVTLEGLTNLLSPQKHARWLDDLREKEAEREREMNALMQSDVIPVHPLRLVKEIRDFIDDETYVIGDGGNIVAQAGKAIQVNKPGHWLDPGRFGCLGVGIPFALAAKLARPDSRVLVINGDGAFGLNGFEFDTAVRFNLPVVSVIGNDAAWGQIRGPQLNFYGAEYAIATALNLARYERVVEALGGYGEYVEEPGKIRGALERAFASGKPACVNVRIDAEANAMVSAGSMAI
jgi:acetolactate synthase-1/2/3 large subunit